ncbi:MAG: hypothetical protein HUJ53_08060 [Holdemanella sp.]|nr:hypothetical protein [Holdemanella sp.]
MRYEDIIHLDHHESRSHPKMTMMNRAAQFAPFAALTGYDDHIYEAGRFTEDKRILGESDLINLDYKIQYIESIMDSHPLITILYFKEDDKKQGGMYITKTGNVRRIDSYLNTIEFMDRIKIKLDIIMDIQIEGFD